MGEIVPVATVFLTNRECPWRCLMCDLWKNTLEHSVAPGMIPAQIEYALQRLGAARQIKLYNSGSFFDPRAIPIEDHPTIAARVREFDRVIVECHPKLVGDACFKFRDRLAGTLEVAMGLETAHPQVLERLNKRMTLDDFSSAAARLRAHGIGLRVFILVKPPFMQEEEALEWAYRSLDFAFKCGATAATLIPTRTGNGAMDQLARIGEFSPPQLRTVEAAAAYGLSLGKGRVFVDLWEPSLQPTCPACVEARIDRLRHLNLSQVSPAPVSCHVCDSR